MDEQAWPVFACEYDYDGSRWTFKIMAPDRADAEARVAALGGRARVLGPVGGSIPAHPSFSAVEGAGDAVWVLPCNDWPLTREGQRGRWTRQCRRWTWFEARR